MSVTLGVIATLGIAFVTYQVRNSGEFSDWQGAMATSIFVILAVCAWISAFLSSRQRPHTGIQLLFVALLVFVLSVPIFIANRGTVVAMVGFLLIMGISLQTLPEKRSNLWIAISAVISIIAVLTDLWIPIDRVAATFTPLPLVGLALAAGVFLLVLLFQYRRLRLRTKLMVTFIAVPTVVVMLVGGFSLYIFLNRLNTQIDQNSITDILTKKNSVNFFLTSVGDDVQFLSQSVTLKNYLETLAGNADSDTVAAAREDLNEEFYAFAQARSIYDQIRFIDASGQEIIRVNTDGNGISTIVPEEDLQNKAGRYYFDDTFALGDGELMISPLDLNVEQGAIETPHKPVIRYGTPVIVNGEKVGVIVTNVLANNFLDLLKDETNANYLVDSDGYYLYHPDEEKRWGRDLETGFKIQQDAPELTKELFSGQTASYNDDINHYAFTPVVIPGEDAPRWYLLNALPLKTAFAPVTETVSVSMAVLAISLMVTSLLALLISQSLTNPMTKLTDAVEEISQGNLDVAVELKNEDELGMLAQTFTQMAARLRNSFSAIEMHTQDLELAAEVSRILSQVHDLDQLLETAVELVRSRFALYYTQIYLINDVRKILVLRAGTGEIGKQLLQQSHSLPIGPGSINGTAVSEKRSIIIPDASQNPLFRANPLLPRTRSEMSVPMLIGDRVVGVLDLQSAEANALTNENLIAFETLANQIAIAIENATLLAEAVAARTEIENYSRRITRDGWDNYLDGIQHPKTIGYELDLQTSTEPNKETTPTTWDNALNIPITIIDQPIGAIQIEANEDQEWTEENLALVQAIAEEVGQQVENLRLLDNATRYQIEAEQAVRRLTHEAWESYEDSADLADGFVYDQMEVKPATAVAFADAAATDLIQQPLSLHGEEVGEIIITKADDTDDAFTDELVTAVADQLVSHMESLRLSEQTERALAESQRRGRELTIINHVVGRISNAAGLQDSMQIIVEELVDAINVDQVRVAMLNNERTKITVIAEKYDTTINESALGLEIPLAGNTLTQDVINTRQTIFIPNCQTSPQTINIREMLVEQHIQSFAVMPIVIDNVAIGTVGLDILDEQKTISDDQIKLAETLILQAATAIQKAQLFEETEARAEELAVINQVAETVARQIDQQELLKAVHEQIQRIMTVDAFFVALYDAQAETLSYPYAYDNDQVYQLPPSKPSKKNFSYQVFQTGKPILINRTQDEIDKLTGKREISSMLGDTQRISASLIFVPLLTGTQTLGILSIQAYQLNAYNQSNIDLLSSIAHHLAVALENTRLLTETRQTAEREHVLREISTTINTAMDAESVLQTAAREIGRALGLETYVYLTPDINVAQQTKKPESNGDQNTQTEGAKIQHGGKRSH